MNRLLLSLALLFCLAMSAAATTMRRYTLEEVRDHAESVFTGQVVSSSKRSVADGKFLANEYVIDVGEVLHGKVGPTTTIIYVVGGDAPRLQRGKTYVFFKTGAPNDTTVGWWQGLFRVENVKNGTATQTILLSEDGHALMTVNGQLIRGQRMAIENGRAVPILQKAGEPKAPVGGATNADGTAARRVAVKKAAKTNAGTFATLDDLKTFVRGKRTPSMR